MGQGKSSNKVRHSSETTSGSPANKDRPLTVPIDEATQLFASESPPVRNELVPGSRKVSEEHRRRRKAASTRRRKGQVGANIETGYKSVRSTLKTLGFMVAKESEENCFLTWRDRPVPLEMIRSLHPYQRINHFPKISQLDRKDIFVQLFSKMAELYPDEYDFHPRTWIFPDEAKKFLRETRREPKEETEEGEDTEDRRAYIVKPAKLNQGRGIELFQNPKDIPVTNTETVVQEYILDPMLVDGYKCDMRIYVLITSCDPLRIYMYNEGLLRLGTAKYSNDGTTTVLKNSFMHLTNYALNKKNKNYTKGNDFNTGSKRSLTFFTRYLRERDIDVDILWDDICDVIVKTILVAEPGVFHEYRSFRQKQTSARESGCFEILGFDVLLDQKLKPWVIEINSNPSLDTAEQIDMEIKSELLADAFHLVNISTMDKLHYEEKRRAEVQKRLYGRCTSATLRVREYKQRCQKVESEKREWEYLLEKLKGEADVNEYDKANSGRFQRIFPPIEEAKKVKYFSLLLDAFTVLYPAEIYPSLKRELEVVYSNESKEGEIRKHIARCKAEEMELKTQGINAFLSYRYSISSQSDMKSLKSFAIR